MDEEITGSLQIAFNPKDPSSKGQVFPTKLVSNNYPPKESEHLKYFLLEAAL